MVDVVCLGPSQLIIYWRTRPGTNSVYEKWHSYTVPQMAFGYFIHNFFAHVSPREVFQSGSLWFPAGGKEPFKDGEIYQEGAMIEALESMSQG